MKGFFRWLQRTNKILRNEKGFVLPLTLVFTFLLFSLLFHQINLYRSEKAFIQQRQTAFVLDRLIQMAAVDIEREFDTKGEPDTSGTFKYEQGGAAYQINTDESTEEVFIIGLTLETKNNGGEHFNWVYYDKINKKIIKWVEGV